MAQIRHSIFLVQCRQASLSNFKANTKPFLLHCRTLVKGPLSPVQCLLLFHANTTHMYTACIFPATANSISLSHAVSLVSPFKMIPPDAGGCGSGNRDRHGGKLSLAGRPLLSFKLRSTSCSSMIDASVISRAAECREEEDHRSSVASISSQFDNLRKVEQVACRPNRSHGVLMYEKQWESASLGSMRRRVEPDAGDSDSPLLLVPLWVMVLRGVFRRSDSLTSSGVEVNRNDLFDWVCVVWCEMSTGASSSLWRRCLLRGRRLSPSTPPSNTDAEPTFFVLSSASRSLPLARNGKMDASLRFNDEIKAMLFEFEVGMEIELMI